MTRSLFWVPRVLCLAFAAFVSIFALDALDEHQGLWPTASAVLLHLVPTALVLGVLAVAWRREWVGALLFTGLGLAHLVASIGVLHWSAFVLVSGPLLAMGLLFLLSWRSRFRRARSA